MPLIDALSRRGMVLTRYRVAILAAVVGVSLSLASYFLVAALNRQLALRGFISEAQQTQEQLQHPLNDYPNAARSLAQFFSISDESISFEQFNAFTEILKAQYPSIPAFVWSPRVLGSERAAFEAKARATVRPDYQIVDNAFSGHPTRAGDRDEYFPSFYATLESGYTQFFGYDASHDPRMAPLYQRAIATGRQQMFGPTPVIHVGSQTPAGYLVITPVFRWDRPHNSPAERAASLQGFVLAVIRVQEAVAQAVANLGSTTNLGLYLFDPAGRIDNRLLYWHSPPGGSGQTPTESALLAGPHVATTIAISERKLGLIVVPPGPLDGGLLDATALAALATGLTFTAMVVFYALVSVRRRLELERLAKDLGTASGKLGFSNTLLTAATETSPDGILVVDGNQHVVLVNHQFVDMMRVPVEVARTRDDAKMLGWVTSQVKDETKFVEQVKYLYEHPALTSHDTVAMKDGRILERDTAPLAASDGRYLGRIWFFREISARVQAEIAREYRGELLHQLAAAAAELLETNNLEVSVPKAIEIVGKAAGAHRVLVIEAQEPRPGRPPFALRFAWNSPDAPIRVDQDTLNQDLDFSDPAFRAFFEPLLEGKPVRATRTEPGGARQLIERLQIASMAIVPVMVDGKYWGQIGFDDCRLERDWGALELDILATLADLVGASVARARHLDELAAADAIIERSPVILYRLGAKPPFPITYVSRNVVQLGYTAAEFLRSPGQFVKLFDAEDFAAVGGHLAQLSQHWESGPPSLWHLRKADGTHRWYENQLHPIFDASGTLTAIEGISVDVDERVNTEAELRRYNSLLDAVTQSVATLLTKSTVAEAVAIALAYIGKSTGEHRILIFQCPKQYDGRYFDLRFAWSKTDEPVRTFDQIIGGEAAPDLMKWFAPLGDGKALIATLETAPESLKRIMRFNETTSLLLVPIFVDGTWWGHVSIEGHAVPRIWQEPEIALFRTLANLIGASIAREQYLEALANADRIVDNSNTILFRGRPQQPMPLDYISQNLRRYGYEAAKFLAAPLLYLDYIHPDDRQALAEAQRRAASESAQAGTVEFRFKTLDGDYRWIESRYNPIRDSSGHLTEVEGVLVDITERKKSEETIATLARTDALTGLANRRTFLERLDQAVAATKRGARQFAVLSLDLDHFKEVNDTLGHPTGDLLLQAIAERLRKVVRETDLVARFGGDEFMILQADVDDPAAAGALAEKIRATVAVPLPIEGNKLQMTASIGIAAFSPEIGDGPGMIEQADVALYRAKEEGRDRYRFHSDEMNTDVRDRMAMIEDLHSALARREFELHYQPLVELDSGRIVGMEALVRWNHPRRGRLLPAAFLPAAERAGLMVPLGSWVLDEACRQLQSWRAAGIALPSMTINLSSGQLKSGDQLIREIGEALAKYGIAPDSIEFDVLETTLAGLTPAQAAALDAMSKLGVRIAIDDFGSELSSLGYVQKFHIAHLKIGRAIVQTAGQDVGRAAAVRAIVDFANDLGVGVVAEGVETRDQRATLLALEPHATAQGFLFSKPLAAAAATAALRAKVAACTDREAELETLPGRGAR